MHGQRDAPFGSGVKARPSTSNSPKAQFWLLGAWVLGCTGRTTLPLVLPSLKPVLGSRPVIPPRPDFGSWVPGSLGVQAERRSLCGGVKARLSTSHSPEARIWLLGAWVLGCTGRGTLLSWCLVGKADWQFPPSRRRSLCDGVPACCIPSAPIAPAANLLCLPASRARQPSWRLMASSSSWRRRSTRRSCATRT